MRWNGAIVPDPSLVPSRPEYYVQTGSMFENPYGVPHDEIIAMLLELPAEVAAQVIFGKYVESSGLVFTGELIQQAIDRSMARITADRWFDPVAREQALIYSRHDKARRFHSGIDLARQTDYTVIFTIDTQLRPARVVNYRRMNRVPWETIYREIGRTISTYGDSIVIDSTGMAGDVIMDALEGRRYCAKHDRTILIDPNGGGGVCRDREGQRLKDCDEEKHISCSTEGYGFSTNSKRVLIEHLRNTMGVGYRASSGESFGWIRTPPIVQLEEELAFYAWDDKGLDTDTVMALALACWQGLEDVPEPIAFGNTYAD